jgi:hypothetical protein
MAVVSEQIQTKETSKWFGSIFIDFPTITPLTRSYFTFRRNHYSFTMLLPTKPAARIFSFIRPHKFTCSMLFVEIEFAIISTAIVIDNFAMSLHLIVRPLSDVCSIAKPVIFTVTMNFIVVKIALIVTLI